MYKDERKHRHPFPRLYSGHEDRKIIEFIKLGRTEQAQGCELLKHQIRGCLKAFLAINREMLVRRSLASEMRPSAALSF